MPANPMRRGFLVAALSSPFVVAAQSPPGRPGGMVLLGGTGSGLVPLQRLAETAGLRALSVVPNLGTGGGLKALAAGAIDLAIAARRLSDEERAKGLIEREVFRTPVVWAVHEGVAQRHITLDELAALYAGRKPSWTAGLPVRLVLRPDSDSDTKFMKAIGPAMADAVTQALARPGVKVATTDSDATEAIERIEGALGVTTLGLVLAERRRLHVLELDGVAPRLETLATQRYPFAKTLTLVTRGSPSGPLADVVQALTARSAAPLLAALGCQSLAA